MPKRTIGPECKLPERGDQLPKRYVGRLCCVQTTKNSMSSLYKYRDGEWDWRAVYCGNSNFALGARILFLAQLRFTQGSSAW